MRQGPHKLYPGEYDKEILIRVLGKPLYRGWNQVNEYFCDLNFKMASFEICDEFKDSIIFQIVMEIHVTTSILRKKSLKLP